MEDTKRVVRVWSSLFTGSNPGALLLSSGLQGQTHLPSRRRKQDSVLPGFGNPFLTLLCMPGEMFRNADKPSWQVMVVGTGKMYAQNQH